MKQVMNVNASHFMVTLHDFFFSIQMIEEIMKHTSKQLNRDP